MKTKIIPIMPGSSMIRSSEVCRRAGIDLSTLHRLIEQGYGPTPYATGPGRCPRFFYEVEVLGFLSQYKRCARRKVNPSRKASDYCI
jgi:predicted DNA-binding transcriptional regulator AlpA